MSRDTLAPLWAAGFGEVVRLTYDEVAAWPAATVKRFEKEGLLVETAPASHVECDACQDAHVERVERVPRGPTAAELFICCPNAGRVSVPPDRVRQWAVSGAALARILSRGLGLGVAAESGAANVRRLGILQDGDTSHEVFLAAQSSDLVSGRVAPSPTRLAIVVQGASASDRSGWRLVGACEIVTQHRGAFKFDRSRLIVAARLAMPPPSSEYPSADGVESPSRVRFKGVDHQCGLTAHEARVLTGVLLQRATPISDLMNSRAGAVWKRLYQARHRNTVNRTLSRINTKLLAASPPLHLAFSIQRGSEYITREDRTYATSAHSPRTG